MGKTILIADAGNVLYERAFDGSHRLTVGGIELRLSEPERGQLLVQGIDPEGESIAGSLTTAGVPLAVPAIDLIRHHLDRLSLDQQMDALLYTDPLSDPVRSLRTLLTLGTRNCSTTDISIWEVSFQRFDAPLSVLRWLAAYSDPLSVAVAARADLPADMIATFVKDARFLVREKIARSPRLTAEQLSLLLLDDAPAIRVAALGNPKLTQPQLVAACHERPLAAEHALTIAELEIATPELLTTAWNSRARAYDKHLVAAALIKNPQTPTAVLKRIAHSGRNSRSKAARRRLNTEAAGPSL